MDDFITSFIEKHQLPDSFHDIADNYYRPLCDWVSQAIDAKIATKKTTPLVLGINGAQGTGKSTLADFIAENLSQDLGSKPGLHVAVISIDDFYLTKADRIKLAEEVHPLLETRGVPGTHDLELASRVMTQLISGQSQVELPRFDKKQDDRFDIEFWPKTVAPVDMIIIEGWCVGSIPEPDTALQNPVNDLESCEDEACQWRTYVNRCLADEYQNLFSLIDHLILLSAPDFESVYRWRLEQEEKLAKKSDASSAKATSIMNAEQIKRFIQHYERLTRYNLSVLPERADVVLALNTDHQVAKLAF